MAIKDGVCEYCGQTVLDENECKCDFAQEEKATLNKINEANDNVKALFVDDAEVDEISQKVIDMLYTANELIANKKIKGLTLTLFGGITAKISNGKDNTIKITRTIKHTDTLEGDE